MPYSVEQLYPAYADGEVARIPALEIIDANNKFKDFILKMLIEQFLLVLKSYI